jgi:hypothetical protein
MYRLPIYNKKELRLSFEFGLILSEVAKEKDVKLTPEMVIEAEDILINELKVNGLIKTAMNFNHLVLAAFEV